MTELISLQHVGFRRPVRTVLSGINLSINQGDFIVITGPNGGGKTTLLNLILGLLKPTSGTISRSPKLKSIGYLPQKNKVDALFPITLREVVASGLLASDIDHERQKRLTSETLELIGLTSHADSAIGQVSGGQLQRALFGRAIIAKPQLLVMDEPLSYLDSQFEQQIIDIITDLAKTTTIILVTHRPDRMAHLATSIIQIP